MTDKIETSRPPVAKLRQGLLNASIWERQSGKDGFYTVTFERRYKDAAGKWQTTHSYASSDLLLLTKLADVAHIAIDDIQSGNAEAARFLLT